MGPILEKLQNTIGALRDDIEASRVAHFVGALEPKSILDVGSCDAKVLKKVVAKVPKVDKYVALDPYPRTPEVVKYDGKNFPFPDKSFDVVCCTYVLHHCVDQTPVISEMKRVGKHILIVEDSIETWVQKKGIILQHDYMDATLDMPYYPDHFRTVKGWESVLADHGLVIVNKQSFATSYPLLFPFNRAHIFHIMKKDDPDLEKFQKKDFAPFSQPNPMTKFNVAFWAYMGLNVAVAAFATSRIFNLSLSK